MFGAYREIIWKVLNAHDGIQQSNNFSHQPNHFDLNNELEIWYMLEQNSNLQKKKTGFLSLKV